MYSSRSSVSEEHLMGPFMSVCLSICRLFPTGVKTCITGVIVGTQCFATVGERSCLNTLLRNSIFKQLVGRRCCATVASDRISARMTEGAAETWDNISATMIYMM
jgi:hypothetical protein